MRLALGLPVKLPAEFFDATARSAERLAVPAPALWNRSTGNVISGHQRLAAMQVPRFEPGRDPLRSLTKQQMEILERDSEYQRYVQMKRKEKLS